jgi:putative endonuclease
MFYVYVLHSGSDHGLYIGYSRNLWARLRTHRAGANFATAHRGPWRLVYYEAYFNEVDARGRERYPKSGAGRTLSEDPTTKLSRAKPSWRNRVSEAVYAAYFSAQFCYSFVGKRVRYPERPGIARPPRHKHNNDLYPCPQPAGSGHSEPVGTWRQCRQGGGARFRV